MQVRTQSHATYLLMYHIVWIPKYRRKLLVNGVDVYCEKVIRSFIQDEYPDMWSIGYFVSSVGLNEDMIKRYVKHQNEQDKGQAVSL